MSYAALAGLFLIGPMLITALAVTLRRPGRRWWAITAGTIAALLVMTAVFDSLMIAADLFRFDQSQLLGPRIGLAPIEDLAWPLAAGLLLPSAWLLLTPERER
ncbi:MAG: lycopene cyclase domain-containing protein [Actinomycetales bacterium]|nr:lycopene cyclase domain-containing protein [Actinomycetales bacterium]